MRDMRISQREREHFSGFVFTKKKKKQTVETLLGRGENKS